MCSTRPIGGRRLSAWRIAPRVALGGVARAALLATAAVILLPAVHVRAQDASPQGPEGQAAPAQPAAPAEPKLSFDDLAAQIRELREEEAELAQQREAAARRELERQEQLARDAVARRDAAEARSAELDRQWEINEQRISQTSELLRQHEGNLGELFGVTRQVAGDAANVLQQSLLTAQYAQETEGEERSEFLRRIAGATALPSITELERLWFELTREMTDGGKVLRFDAPVLQLNGEPIEKEVVRVGPFTAVADGQFLGYLPSRDALTELDGQLGGAFRNLARQLQQTPANGGYTRAVVDPAGGALLGLYIERPGVMQRIKNGEIVGYVIIAVGILGVLLAMFQYGYLLKTRVAVKAQLRQLSQPNRNNPLGRLLLAFRRDGKEPESAELAELRLSEAVLHEVPKLERFQSFLRLAVAAGPLLGLIGTVIGMIITFHAIVASGSSDPKLMAHGIGQAMIATVLGLGIAIPLLFINAGLTAFSRTITQVLHEQSQALLAETISGNRHVHQ